MLGTTATRVPVYGSGGWLSFSDDELLDEVLRYKARGFRAVKIKVGSPSIEQDLADELRRGEVFITNWHIAFVCRKFTYLRMVTI